MSKEKTSLDIIKENYEKLRKQYDLPKFEDIDMEFELRKSDETTFLRKEIRRAILHKLQGTLNYLETSLEVNPSSLHSFIESEAFTKTERENATIFYRRIGYLLHKGLKSGLGTEQDEMEFIKELWDEWPQIKEGVKSLMDKIMAAWKKNLPDDDEKQIYFG